MDLYHYNAEVVSVYDGDTLTLHIDLGFEVWLRNQKIRVYGVDTPELRGAEREDGLRVRDLVRERLPVGQPVVLESIKDKTGKYGRWLGRIHVPDDQWELSKWLLAEGHAVVPHYMR